MPFISVTYLSYRYSACAYLAQNAARLVEESRLKSDLLKASFDLFPVKRWRAGWTGNRERDELNGQNWKEAQELQDIIIQSLLRCQTLLDKEHSSFSKHISIRMPGVVTGQTQG